MKITILHRSLPLLVLLVAHAAAFGQPRYYDKWYFGDLRGLDFAAAPPALLEGAMQTEEGCSSICDPITGALLFYTNGVTVWNRDHQVMVDGTDLFGHISSSQSALIVPDPGNGLRYYIFTVDALWPSPARGLGLNYSIVDMREDGGKGKVTEKNVPVFAAASEKLVGIRHCNGRDYWIMTHEFPGDAFHAWLLSDKGFSTDEVISKVGLAYGPGSAAATYDAGTLKASPDGRQVFASRIVADGGTLSGELFGFDASTGAVGPKLLDIEAGYDAAFSPDNRFLYVSHWDTILQYDTRPVSGTIAQSKKMVGVVPDSRYVGGIQLGPDGRLYMLNTTSESTIRLDVIDKPNLPGANADYRPGLFTFDGFWLFSGLPNCIDGYLGDETIPNSAGKLTVTGDTIICRGAGTQLLAEGAARYRWTPSEGLSCDTCANPTVMPAQTTTYRVTGYVDGSCLHYDTVAVTVHIIDPPVIDAGPAILTCLGKSVELRAEGGLSYRWDFSPDLSCLDCPDPIASPATTTTYYVTGTNAEGCTGRDSVKVEVYPEIVGSAGEDKVICPGDSAQLQATDGVRWHWEPADGLSCTDCREPIALPDKTTRYILTAWNAEGCMGTDTVEVIVKDQPEIVHLRIGRDYRIKINEPGIFAVEWIGPDVMMPVETLEFTLDYDARLMQVRVDNLKSLLGLTPLEGWDVIVMENLPGHLVLRFISPKGKTTIGKGILFRFEGVLFLSNVQGTELPFSLRGDNPCFVFETDPGYAEPVVCGLNFRLIELTSEKYVAPVVSPNPAQDRVMFEFVLGLSGTTLLEVFDALGNRVGLIVDRDLQPGKYAVEWDVRGLASGVYWYRLRSGDWSRTGEIRIRE